MSKLAYIITATTSHCPTSWVVDHDCSPEAIVNPGGFKEVLPGTGYEGPVEEDSSQFIRLRSTAVIMMVTVGEQISLLILLEVIVRPNADSRIL